MSTLKKKNKKADTKALFADIFIGAMLAIVVGIMPLIVRIALRPVPNDLAHIFPRDIHVDAFAHGKAWFIAIPAVVILLYCVIDWLTGGKIPKLKPYLKRIPIILSLVYLAFAFVSTVASSYLYTSFFGTIDREEGLFMWLVYFIVFAATMFYVRTQTQIRPILFALAFSSIIMGAIGVSQLLDRDFFDTAVAEWLVTAGVDGVSNMQTRFTIAHGTLYNPNTFGKYTAMVAPILLITAVTYSGKIYTKFFLFAGGAFMLFSVFASSSLGGFIGIATAAGVLIVTYVCNLVYNLVKSDRVVARTNALRIGALFVAMAVAIVAVITFIESVNTRFHTFRNRLFDSINAEPPTLVRYRFDGNTMYGYHGDDRFFAISIHTVDPQVTEGWFTAYNGQGQPLAISEPIVGEETVTWHLSGTELWTMGITRNNELMHSFSVGPQGQTNLFLLTLIDGNIYGNPRTIYGDWIDLSQEIPSWGFEGQYRWGSSRGYIWARAFPLMPRRTLIGSGPDTFINVFPQHDMAGLHEAFGDPYQVVDKAHNMFIQTWITTGGVSAIALFGLFAFYIFTTFWGLITAKNEPLSIYGLRLGLLAGISAFVMSSMATDSTIGSTGVFFVLLGLGYSVNEFLKNNHNSANNNTQNATK